MILGNSHTSEHGPDKYVYTSEQDQISRTYTSNHDQINIYTSECVKKLEISISNRV